MAVVAQRMYVGSCLNRRSNCVLPRRPIPSTSPSSSISSVAGGGSSPLRVDERRDDRELLWYARRRVDRRRCHSTYGGTDGQRPLLFSSSFTSLHHHNNLNEFPNDEVVEGAWIFHRHGDRCPSSPLWIDEDDVDAEARFWRTRLPDPSAVASVAQRFPPVVHRANDDEDESSAGSGSSQRPYDVKREPFGYLTKLGTYQMYNKGRSFARRYAAVGRRGNDVDEVNDDDESRYDLSRHYDVRAYSTNYLRTITSAQFFLHGLLPPDRGDHELPRVHVRARERDTLNAFDKNPERMAALVRDVVSGPTFQRRDGDAVPLADELAEQLPGLRAPANRRRLFGGPSGVNWIHAADHFVCRTAHSRTLRGATPRARRGESCAWPRRSATSPTNDDDDDDDDERRMEALASPTVSHLAWRFHQWYESPPLLGAIAAPPLAEVARGARRRLEDVRDNSNNNNNNNNNNKGPFTIFSCHDVTVLSLLYGLGADVVAANGDGGRTPRFWPPYATTLAFELVRRPLESDRCVVRVSLNGAPATMRSRRAVDGVLDPDAFFALAEELEARNGDDDPDATDAETERDMSTWTG